MVVGKVPSKVRGHLTGVNVPLQFVHIRQHYCLGEDGREGGREGGREVRGREAGEKEGGREGEGGREREERKKEGRIREGNYVRSRTTLA